MDQQDEIISTFDREVHNARVFGCAFCAELCTEPAGKEPLYLQKTDPNLKRSHVKGPDPPKRHANEEFNARHFERGYIKELVGKHGANMNQIPVCAHCHAEVSRGRAESIWQTAYDFGRRPGFFNDLSEIEKEILPAARHYVVMIHIATSTGGSAKTLRGNTICFPQKIFYNRGGYVERGAAAEDDAAPAADAAAAGVDAAAAAPPAAAPPAPAVIDPFENLNVSFLFTGPNGMKTTVDGWVRTKFFMASVNNLTQANEYLRLSNPLLYGNRRFPDGQALQDCLARFADDVMANNFYEAPVPPTRGSEPGSPSSPFSSNRGSRRSFGSRTNSARFEEAENAEADVAPPPPPPVAAADAAAAEGAEGEIQYRHEGEVVADDAETIALASRKSKAQCLMEARQGSEPVNEFSNNRLVFEGGFPDLFPNEGCYPTNSLPPPKLLRHFMRYYDGRFQKSSRFIFAQNSQRVRAGAARNNAKVSRAFVADADRRLSGPDSDAFYETLASANKKVEEKRRGALTSDESAALRFVQQAINISYHRVSFTRSDRSIGRWWVNSIVRARGVPGIFLTFSPSLVDNSLGMRLSVGWGGDGGAAEGSDPRLLEYDMRSNIVFANPGRSAMFFEHVVDTFREHVLKLSKSVLRKTTPHSEMPVGLFGQVLDYFQAVECQGRSLLHLHVLLWTAVSPEKLSGMIGVGELKRALDHVDEIMTATLPKEFYEARHQLWVDRQPAPVPFLTDERPFETLTEDERLERLYSILARYNIHFQHKPSCSKGMSHIKPEDRFCRYCFGRNTAL